MVEVGARRSLNDGMILRPYAAVGLSFLTNNTRVVSASFVGAQAADGTFANYIRSPDLLENLDLGLQLYREGGFEVRAGYMLRAGGEFLAQGGSARVAFHF
jgi:hypothetical protein